MSRHSKNSTASPVFSYHERQQLKEYGTQTCRVGKASLKTVDQCFLCLHTLIDPLSCPKGHLYCKTCIYESLLSQQKRRKEEKKKISLNKLKSEEEEEIKQLEHEKKKIEQFDKMSNTLSVKEGEPEKKMTMNAYWLPSLTPSIENKETKKLPNILCPQHPHPLRLKQLLKVIFKKDGENSICPLCKKSLHAIPSTTLIKKCGHVYCTKCTKEFIQKSFQCSECSVLVDDDDLIKIDSTSSPYASIDNIDKVLVKKSSPAPRFS